MYHRSGSKNDRHNRSIDAPDIMTHDYNISKGVIIIGTFYFYLVILLMGSRNDNYCQNDVIPNTKSMGCEFFQLYQLF